MRIWYIDDGDKHLLRILLIGIVFLAIKTMFYNVYQGVTVEQAMRDDWESYILTLEAVKP